LKNQNGDGNGLSFKEWPMCTFAEFLVGKQQRQIPISLLNGKKIARRQWLRLVILATQKAEIRRIWV
jgi:hypothetical protein